MTNCPSGKNIMHEVIDKEVYEEGKILNAWAFTLKALQIVESMKSRTKPPASVPSMPHTTVIPPKIISALFCKRSGIMEL